MDRSGFTCKLCPRVFDNTALRAKHFKFHFGFRPLPCGTCELRFKNRSHLLQHQLTHAPKVSKKSKVQADKKGTELERSKEKKEKKPVKLDKGIASSSITDSLQYKCPACTQVFNRSSKLEQHKRLHINELPFACSVCKNRFSCEGSVSEHMKNSHHINDKPQELDKTKPQRKCLFCPEIFTGWGDLNQKEQRHMRKIHFQCLKCTKVCKNKSVLLLHERAPMKACKMCKKPFHQAIDLAKHMSDVHNVSMKLAQKPGETNKRFPCQTCTKILKSKKSFEKHQQMHSKERPKRKLNFQCHICDHKCMYKYQLRVHMRRHSNKRKFGCQACGSRFKFKSGLIAHERTHARETTEVHRHAEVTGEQTVHTEMEVGARGGTEDIVQTLEIVTKAEDVVGDNSLLGLRKQDLKSKQNFNLYDCTNKKEENLDYVGEKKDEEQQHVKKEHDDFMNFDIKIEYDDLDKKILKVEEERIEITNTISGNIENSEKMLETPIKSEPQVWNMYEDLFVKEEFTFDKIDPNLTTLNTNKPLQYTKVEVVNEFDDENHIKNINHTMYSVENNHGGEQN